MPVGSLTNPNLSSVTSNQLGNPTAQLPTPELSTISEIPTDFVSVGDFSPLPPDVINELEKVPKPEGKFDTSVLRNITNTANSSKEAFKKGFNYLPNTTKNSISTAVQGSAVNIKKTVKVISTTQQVVVSVDRTLSTIGQQSETLDTTVNALQKAKNIILKLPAPTSTPPGIGIPLSVINGLSNTLDGLSKFIEKTGDVIDIIKVALQPILRVLGKVKDLLLALLRVTTIALDIIQFMIEVIKPPVVEGEEIEEENDDLTNLNEELALASNGIEPSPTERSSNTNLRDQLQPNSTTPLIYKDFLLTLQENIGDNNLTQSRIQGTNSERQLTLNTEYSYTTSLEVLVNEMKFKIDNYDSSYGTPTTPGRSPENITTSI